MGIVQLNENHTQCALDVLVRGPGTYTVKSAVRADGFYASTYVRSIDPGATLDIEYYQATSGATFGERVVLETLDQIDDTATLPLTVDACIPKFHHMVCVDYVVTGGNVEFGALHSSRSISKTDLAATFDSKGEPCIRVCGESIPQGLANEGKVTLIGVNAAAWTRFVVTPLGLRRAASIQNTDGFGNDNPFSVLVNYANPATPAVPPAATHGMVIRSGEERFYDVNDNVDFWIRVVPGGSSFNVVFEEIA